MVHGRQGPELRAAIATSRLGVDAPRECRSDGCAGVCPPRKTFCASCLALELGSARARVWGIATEGQRRAALGVDYTPPTDGLDWQTASPAELGAGGGCSGCGFSVHNCQCRVDWVDVPNTGKQGALL